VFYLLHDVKQLDLDPGSASISVVLSGHSHKPLIEHRRGVLFLNPGSAGPRRFSLPIALAMVTLGDGAPRAEVIDLLG
jgi:predicted phosphodiesterase